MHEIEIKKHLLKLSQKNKNTEQYACFLGAGAYNHWIPSAVNHIASRAEFYTAYTPYQPEVSQGTLQAIYEFQSWICQLTGLDVANASLYDGATALAEATLMALRITKKDKIIMASTIHPAYKKVLESYLQAQNVNIIYKEKNPSHLIDNDTAAVIIQQPNFYGDVFPDQYLSELSQKTKEKKGLFICCIDPIFLGITTKPSKYMADIVVGEGQPLGMPLCYGGPFLGFIACKEQYLRQLPGRIIGETLDTNDNRAFVLTMQTREQHIRREKATSNICSNQSLCALRAAVYLSLLGEKGLKEIALLCQKKTNLLKNKLSKLNFIKIVNTEKTFKEFTIVFSNAIKTNNKSLDVVKYINKELLKYNIIGGYELSPDKMILAVTEMVSDTEIEHLVKSLHNICSK